MNLIVKKELINCSLSTVGANLLFPFMTRDYRLIKEETEITR